MTGARDAFIVTSHKCLIYEASLRTMLTRRMYELIKQLLDCHTVNAGSVGGVLLSPLMDIHHTVQSLQVR